MSIFKTVWFSCLVFAFINKAGGRIILNETLKPSEIHDRTSSSSWQTVPSNQLKWVAKSIVPEYLLDFHQLYVKQGAFLQESFLSQFVDNVPNPACIGHILEWMIRFSSNDWTTEEHKWAAHLIDSWGKIQEGILTGHVSSYGDFDECVDATAKEIKTLNTIPELQNIPKSFEGSYCTMYLVDYASAAEAAGSESNIARQEWSLMNNKTNSNKIDSQRKKALSVEEFLNEMMNPTLLPLVLNFGICMPNSCSVEDVQNVFFVAFNRMYTSLNVTDGQNLLWPLVGNCRDNHKPDPDAAVIIVIIILATLLLLGVTAGIVDYLQQQRALRHETEKPTEHGLAYKYFMAFSLYSNTKKWLSTRRSPDDFECLHGIRFFSTAWVVLAHTYLIFLSTPQWNLVDLMESYKIWTMLPLMNGTLSVDTFFVMSGMLVAYNILKMLDKSKGKLNVPMLYFHRFVRITPTYAILVAIGATITSYLGRGPNWGEVEYLEQQCRKNWWWNILYINNFFKNGEMCYAESWYLANDMQFYILSPAIIYPIWKWRKLGLSLLSVYTVLSCIAPALAAEFYDAAPYAPIVTRLNDDWDEIYIRPWVRIQTFLVGVWLGWIFHETKGKRIKLPPWLAVAGWVISAATALS